MKLHEDRTRLATCPTVSFPGGKTEHRGMVPGTSIGADDEQSQARPCLLRVNALHRLLLPEKRQNESLIQG